MLLTLESKPDQGAAGGGGRTPGHLRIALAGGVGGRLSALSRCAGRRRRVDIRLFGARCRRWWAGWATAWRRGLCSGRQRWRPGWVAAVLINSRWW